MTDDEAIRQAHQPDRPTGYRSCITCMVRIEYEYPQPVPWPCDAAELLADADALAEALMASYGGTDPAKFTDMRLAALNAHRARKP